MNSWPGYEIILYAEATGLFAKRGLDVKFVHFEEQSDNLRATMRGYQDASFAALSQAMQADIPEAQPEFILVTDVSAGSDGIVVRPGVNSMEELANKKISARLGSLSHLILLEALQANNVDLNSVEIVDLANEEGAEQLKEGTIDGAVLWQPLLGQTARDMGGKIIYTTADVDSIIVDGLVSCSNIVKTKKEELVSFIEVWLEVMDAVETNPEEVFTVMAQKLDLPKKIFAEGFQGMKPGDRALNKKMLVDGYLYPVIQRIYQLLLDDTRQGLIIRKDVVINAKLFSEAVNRP
jgi:NitT/TauT family transport system substrate-binding protein